MEKIRLKMILYWGVAQGILSFGLVLIFYYAIARGLALQIAFYSLLGGFLVASFMRWFINPFRHASAGFVAGIFIGLLTPSLSWQLATLWELKILAKSGEALSLFDIPFASRILFASIAPVYLLLSVPGAALLGWLLHRREHSGEHLNVNSLT